MVENIVELLRSQIERFGATAWGDNEESLLDELAHVMHRQGRCELIEGQVPAGCVVSIDKPISDERR